MNLCGIYNILKETNRGDIRGHVICATTPLSEALHIYRTTFRPSQSLAEPYAIVAASVCGADTEEEAIYLRSSQVLSFGRMRTNQRGKLPRPVHDLKTHVPEHIRVGVEQSLTCSATGNLENVHRGLSSIIEKYQPDELMVTGWIHDHDARRKSFAIAAEALQELRKEAA